MARPTPRAFNSVVSSVSSLHAQSRSLLSQPRCHEPSPTIVNEAVDNGHLCIENDDATLEEYEELLLASAEHDSGSEDVSAFASDTKAVHQGSGGESPTPSAMDLVNCILDLLPSDGTAIRLTAITPAIDAEAVSEVCGSVLKFIQLFPHRFCCHKMEDHDGGLRWFVGRAKPSESPQNIPIFPSVALNQAAHCAAQETQVNSAQRHVKLHEVHKVLSNSEKVDVLQRLKEFIPAGEAVATVGLLQSLPFELQDLIRSSVGGVVRLLKEPFAEEYVDLSADTLLVAQKGVLTLQGVEVYNRDVGYTAAKGCVAPVLAASEDYAEDAWEVELDLESNDAVLAEDADLDGTPLSEADSNFFHNAAQETCAFPPIASVIPPAPPKPQKRVEKPKTPPPLPRVRAEKEPRSVKMTPEELLRVHTEVARLRGRRSPRELLDLFVECIPTVYVQVQKIKVTEALARVLGPLNTLHKVIRIYSYYFDWDREADTVRLKPSLEHSRLGVANALYEANTAGYVTSVSGPRKLQQTDATRAFPVLQTPLRTKGTAPPKNADASSKSGLELPAVSSLPSVETFALLEALPHDQYIDLSEWANAANTSEAVVERFARSPGSSDFLLFRDPDNAEDGRAVLCRLRPYWLAPGCSGELGVDDSPEMAFVSRHLKPLWMSVERVMQKLSLTEHKLVLAAAQSYGGVTQWLRQHGRICWVDAKAQKVRRYCASEELDDVTHVLVLYLQSTLSTELVPFSRLLLDSSVEGGRLDRCRGIKGLLIYGYSVWKRDVQDANVMGDKRQTTENIHQDNILKFLAHHRQRIDVKVEDKELWVGRHSYFRQRK
ncbi:hypothetical protein ERJ75_000930700 [Trypanosoma vivax]|nr:hypothetical protein ERJ75_000930700 [Trypanosoma vivax]